MRRPSRLVRITAIADLSGSGLAHARPAIPAIPAIPAAPAMPAPKRLLARSTFGRRSHRSGGSRFRDRPGGGTEAQPRHLSHQCIGPWAPAGATRVRNAVRPPPAVDKSDLLTGFPHIPPGDAHNIRAIVRGTWIASNRIEFLSWIVPFTPSSFDTNANRKDYCRRGFHSCSLKCCPFPVRNPNGQRQRPSWPVDRWCGRCRRDAVPHLRPVRARRKYTRNACPAVRCDGWSSHCSDRRTDAGVSADDVHAIQPIHATWPDDARRQSSGRVHHASSATQ